MVRGWTYSSRAILLVIIAISFGTGKAHAQEKLPRIALRSGESVDLRNFFFIANCQSVLTSPTVVEVLEGPDEVTLKIRDEMVLPRGYSCAKPVPGGVVVATAQGVMETKEAKLTFRLKYNTKQGPRQNSNTYIVSLYPGAAQEGASIQSTPSMNSTPSAEPTSPH